MKDLDPGKYRRGHRFSRRRCGGVTEVESSEEEENKASKRAALSAEELIID